MRLDRVFLALAIAVALSVILVAEAFPYGQFSGVGAPGGAGPTPLTVWAQRSYQGELAGGVDQAVVLPVPPVPSAAAAVYVDGSFSMLTYSLVENGTFRQGGSCAALFANPDACNVYLGVWSPGAWAAYTAGGALDPVWCFPGSGSGCGNISGAEFDTPNLRSLDGAGWEIVIWNLATYDLSGSYSVTVYSDATAT